MFSKVLLFVLISCTLTLASPVHRNGETLNEANFPNEEVKEAVENIIIKVSQAVKEVLEALTKQISEGLNSEALRQSVEKLVKLLQEAFNTNENEQSPSEQEIQKAVNDAVKNISEVYKGILNAFFQKVETLNDEELNKSIEHLKIILEKIFAYNNINKVQRSLSAPEENDNLTYEELEKVEESLKGLLQDLLLQILENSNEEINSEEAEIIKNILEKFFSDLNDNQ